GSSPSTSGASSAGTTAMGPELAKPTSSAPRLEVVEAPVPHVVAAPSAERPVEIVYVIGGAGSGRPIFGVALGNCPGYFYGGELDAWLRLGGIPTTVSGRPAAGEFWEGVRGDLAGYADLTTEANVRLLDERSTGLLRPDRIWR